MDESILSTIKAMLDVPEDQTSFDMELLTYINGAFFTLNQLGVGPDTPFVLENGDTVWSEFTDDINKLQLVKSYVFLKVKCIFDSAAVGSASLSAFERQIAEMEWRLNVAVDPKDEV